MKQETLSIFSKKDVFLYNLQSGDSYKRYTQSPIRYAGGKSLGVGYIIEHIPANVNSMMSPFMGGGSVEIACANELGIRVRGFDVFDILATYWDVQLNRAVSLANMLDRWSPAKESYTEIKKILKAHYDGETPLPSALEIAACYWFNHNLSYGPQFLGWQSKQYESMYLYRRAVDRVRNFSCPSLQVEQGCFEDTIPSHETQFMYLDPPYYLDDGKMFKGIYPSINLPIHHKGFNHELLRDLLHNHKNRFVLSYNDCDTIREWYSDFQIVEVEWQYTLGQGESRIGRNRKKRGESHIKESHELLIVKT